MGHGLLQAGGDGMNLHIQTRYDKWNNQWFFDTYRSLGEICGELLEGHGIQFAIAGHVFTIIIHWKEHR
jgi:hypothetical protein